VLVKRNGDERRRFNVAGYDLTGTPDGFVYATQVNDSTALVHVNTRTLANSGETVWLGEGLWRVLWAGEANGTNFESWTQLAEPLPDPSAVLTIDSTPTPLPPFFPFRQIGMAVQIYTEDDEYLNLRDAPTTDSTVLALLESGRQALIIDGPIDADGFRWWQIRVGSREGWVVEALPEVLTLIPPQFIPEVTEEPEAD
jgi:hypothetical protein